MDSPFLRKADQASRVKIRCQRLPLPGGRSGRRSPRPAGDVTPAGTGTAQSPGDASSRTCDGGRTVVDWLNHVIAVAEALFRALSDRACLRGLAFEVITRRGHSSQSSSGRPNLSTLPGGKGGRGRHLAGISVMLAAASHHQAKIEVSGRLSGKTALA
jgi:hypothetical protein